MRPFLKWVGGKAALAPTILTRMPLMTGLHYHEPFLGGGAVFFALASGTNQPQSYTLSDANRRLIQCYTHLRSDPEQVIHQLDETLARAGTTSRSIAREYYAARERMNCNFVGDGTAADFLFLNKTSYNGVYRENKKGLYNVPWGKKVPVPEFDHVHLRACTVALSHAYIQVGDFEDDNVTNAARDGFTVDMRDYFFYLDPPYHKTFDTYTASRETNDLLQRRLAAYCERLDKAGARFLLSNSSTSLIKQLYYGLNVETVENRRSVSRDGEGRGTIKEVLIRNY